MTYNNARSLAITGQQATLSVNDQGYATEILFAIHDLPNPKRLALYLFTDKSELFLAQEEVDGKIGKQTQFTEWAKLGVSQVFTPKQPRRVGDFAWGYLGGPDEALAHLKLNVKNIVLVGSTLFLQDGPENLELNFAKSNPVKYPKEHLKGRIIKLDEIPFSAQELKSPSLLRKPSPLYKQATKRRS